jgi:hypothetical protein
MADGHLNKCKDCARKDTNQYRKDNPIEALKTRIRTCEKNPTHMNANRVVNAAVEAGVINRPDECQGCGRKASETRLSAHHHDYTKPLDVIWLCAACHRPIDKVRAFVESGKSWDDWKHEKDMNDSKIRRALKFYRESGKERKGFWVETHETRDAACIQAHDVQVRAG